MHVSACVCMRAGSTRLRVRMQACAVATVQYYNHHKRTNRQCEALAKQNTRQAADLCFISPFPCGGRSHLGVKIYQLGHVGGQGCAKLGVVPAHRVAARDEQRKEGRRCAGTTCCYAWRGLLSSNAYSIRGVPRVPRTRQRCVLQHSGSCSGRLQWR